MRRLSLSLACALLGALAFAAAAPAAAVQPVCGTTPKGALEPVKGTLALTDTDPETVTAALYGRGTGPRQLTLVYTVSGCRLEDWLPPPEDPPSIGPPQDAKVDPIPKGVIRLSEARPKIDGDQYVVHLTVHTAPPAYQEGKKQVAPKFAPGTYGGFVDLDADWMHRTGTPVAIARSENRWLLVLGLAAMGALGGFVIFMLVHEFSHAKLLVGAPKIVLAGLISVGVGAYVGYKTNYLDQDVWTFGANTVALLTAAFTGATTGHLATGLLGKVYDDHGVLHPKDPAHRSAIRRAARAARAATRRKPAGEHAAEP